MKENTDINHVALMKQHSMANSDRDAESSVLSDTGNLEHRRKSIPYDSGGTLFCYTCQHIVGGTPVAEEEHRNHDVAKLREASMVYKVRLGAAVLKVRALIRYSNIVIKDLESYLDRIGACMADLTAEVLERASLAQSEHQDPPQTDQDQHYLPQGPQSEPQRVPQQSQLESQYVTQRQSQSGPQSQCQPQGAPESEPQCPPLLDIAVQTVVGDIHNEQQGEIVRIRAKVEEFEKFIGSAKGIAIKCDHLSNVKDEKVVLTEGKKHLAHVKSLEKSLPVCPVERCLYMLSSSVKPSNSHMNCSGEMAISPEQFIGDFSKHKVPWRLEVKRTASFRPDAVASARFVTTMCSAGDEKVWVVWHWGPLIHCVDKDGKVVEIVNAGCKVDDVCTDKDGNLVIACHETRCIKILNSNYEVHKTISMEKVPRGVKFCSRDELVVCCVQNLHHRNGDVSNVLKVQTDVENVNELSNSVCDTLVQPWRVAVNINGDVCVSDRNKGAVIIFNDQGDVKATYSGPETSTRHAFAPHGIGCDSLGQIFVVDYTNHTVHVLDPLGRFRGFLIMDTELEKRAIFMGCSSPFSIAIDSVGDIWVGNKFGYLTVLKYQK